MQIRSSLALPTTLQRPPRPQTGNHTSGRAPGRAADIAACRALLRNGSKTFLAASLLLPRAVHEPACVLYAFCRQADDAVDAQNDHNAVARLRDRLTLAYAGTPEPTPADRALAEVVVRFQIPRSVFDALLEGFEWDAAGRLYETLDDLHDYAARVAGTVGAMMALVMGVRSPEAVARACDLGVAMQLSNIARDVGEDAALGRLYLPRAWLREAGIEPDAWLAEPVFSPALASVVQRLLDAAEALYVRVDAGVACLPLACRPGINAARYLYAEIGHEVARRCLNSVKQRAVVPPARKARVLLRALTRLRPAAASHALPPLAATRFLVDATVEAAARAAPLHAPAPAPAPAMAALAAPATQRRNFTDRMVWTIELFARLEQQDRLRMQGSAR